MDPKSNRKLQEIMKGLGLKAPGLKSDELTGGIPAELSALATAPSRERKSGIGGPFDREHLGKFVEHLTGRELKPYQKAMLEVAERHPRIAELGPDFPRPLSADELMKAQGIPEATRAAIAHAEGLPMRRMPRLIVFGSPQCASFSKKKGG